MVLCFNIIFFCRETKKSGAKRKVQRTTSNCLRTLQQCTAGTNNNINNGSLFQHHFLLSARTFLEKPKSPEQKERFKEPLVTAYEPYSNTKFTAATYVIHLQNHLVHNEEKILLKGLDFSFRKDQ